MLSKKVWYDNIRCRIEVSKENKVYLVLDENFLKEKAVKDGFVQNGEHYELLIKKEDVVEYEGINCYIDKIDQNIVLIPVLWNDSNARDFQLTIIKSLGIHEVIPGIWGIPLDNEVSTFPKVINKHRHKKSFCDRTKKFLQISEIKDKSSNKGNLNEEYVQLTLDAYL